MLKRSALLLLLVVVLGGALPSQAATYSKKYFVTNNDALFALKSNPRDDFGNPAWFGNPVQDVKDQVGYTGEGAVDGPLGTVYSTLSGTPLNENFLAGTPADHNFLDDALPVAPPAWPVPGVPAPGPYSSKPGNTNVGGVTFSSFSGTPTRITISDVSETPIRWSACALVGENAGSVCGGDADTGNDDITVSGCGSGNLTGFAGVREINVWIIGNDSVGFWGSELLEPCDGAGTWGTITLTTA